MRGNKFVSEKIWRDWYKTGVSHVGAYLEPNLRGLFPKIPLQGRVAERLRPVLSR
jgi:hypothetical protein